jgi:hypothetical protein
MAEATPGDTFSGGLMGINPTLTGININGD